MVVTKSKRSRHLCIRPAEVIEAKYSLNKRQNDLVDMVLQQVQDDDRVKFEVDLKQYCKYTGIEYSDSSKECLNIVKSFSEDDLGFWVGEGRIFFTNWFASVEYKGKDIIEVEMSEKLKNIIVECKRAIFYRPEIPIGLNNKYSPRMYYFLKLYEDTGIRIDKVENFKVMLDCEKYDFYDLKRFILEPTKKEINNSPNTDIKFDYETFKVGKKVEAIKFYIKKVRKTSNKPKELIDDQDKVITEAIQYLGTVDIKIARRTLTRIRNTYSNELLLRAVNIMVNNSETEKIKTPTKYLTGILENLIKKDKEQKDNKENDELKKSDFEPRQYDYDKLEDALIYGVDSEEEIEDALTDLRYKK